uniref:MutS2 protein n=1 Tax=Anthurium amnicola TaxID=1678845 RepID=A0A1D1XPS1_9ARAE
MLQSALLCWTSAPVSFIPAPRHFAFRIRVHPRQQLQLSSTSTAAGVPPPSLRSSVLLDSLRVLEWDKVCDAVASFTGTPLGRDATKELLWRLDFGYEDTKSLLAETAAAVEMIKYGAGGMDLGGIDVVHVKLAIDRASRGLPINGTEAIAISSLLEFSEMLQITVKTAIKEDSNWYNRFMPVAQVVMELIVNQPFVKLVRQMIDEDGSVKDNASSELKRFRDQVLRLEQKLYQLMDKLIRSDRDDVYSGEVSTINGRWCIKSTIDRYSTFEGLLLSSGPGAESFIEPLIAVQLNDELQLARALVAKAEEDVLSGLTDKMVPELDDIRSLLYAIIQLDVVFARAKYSLAFGGTFPELSTWGDGEMYSSTSTAGDVPGERTDRTFVSYSDQKRWKLYLRKAYHPLLLKQHYDDLQKARKDVTSATSEIRRARLQGNSMITEGNAELHLATLKLKVAEIEENHPVPVDFLVSTKINVLVITGPNTGGKTIGLKTLGLASMMAKSGLYVLASEPVQIPWFDAIFADIGDEQSLAQSLSTFSGHMKQISAIQSQSTSRSLVLLDEVGAGTNPLEGAALGMSLLESFSKMGALLTIATTHHGELKTLKYSNKSFENACVEFDEVNLKPTYKILWGVPGRSNALNIAERLGLPSVVLRSAHKLYGKASMEINGAIVDMERLKQEFQQHFHEAQHYMKLSRKNYESLLASKQKIHEYSIIQNNKKVQAILGAAAVARSLLHAKLQVFRETSDIHTRKEETSDNMAYSSEHFELPSLDSSAPETFKSPAPGLLSNQKPSTIPQVGDMVDVPTLGKKGMVLKVEASKGEIVVQAGNMKLRLKLSNFVTQEVNTL